MFCYLELIKKNDIIIKIQGDKHNLTKNGVVKMKKDWEFGIKTQMITKEALAKRIKELGRQITEDLKDEDAPLVVVGLLKGSIIFMADLVREIKLPLVMDFMSVSSYGEGFESTREVKILKDLEGSIQGKHVLIVEDIIDSGMTLKKVLKVLGGREPKKISLCTLLDKPDRREVEVDVQYVGFEIPNEFVLGYGLDFIEEYRNIPYVALAADELYKK